MHNLSQTQKNENIFFDFNSMILHVFSRYCYQLIFSEIFDISFELKQIYKYSFTGNEIRYLSHLKENELILKKSINAPYKFSLSHFFKTYEGNINIEAEFKNNGTFEKSYYEIIIEITNNKNSFKLFPFFLNEIGFKTLISEFINKLWIQILLQLTNTKPSTPARKSLTLLTTPIRETDLKKILKIDENEDIIFDVFHILHSYYYLQKNKQKGLYISADEILKARGLIQNANSVGYRSGYKIEQKQRIHAAFNILNALNLINMNEISQFHYLFFPNSKIFKTSLTNYPIRFAQYNLKTQLWERRFSYYFYDNKKEKHKISSLLALVKDISTSLKPMQIRDKTEYILDKLCDDKIIKSWHYLKIQEDSLTGKNWIEKWMNLYIFCRY